MIDRYANFVEQIGVSKDFLDRIFPFHLVIDDSGKLKSIGPVMLRISGLKIDEPIREYVEILRPVTTFDIEALDFKKAEVCFLRLIKEGIDLRGQIEITSNQRGALILCFPYIREIAHFNKLPFQSIDFPNFDSTIDFMLLLQAQKNFMQESIDKEQYLKLEAQKSSESKSIFLTSMSHEFRTPLNVIIGYAELLAEDSRSQNFERELLRIISSGKSLLELVDTVLNLAKAESCSFSVVPKQFSIKRLIQDVSCRTQAMVVKGRNNFSVDIADGPDHFISDRDIISKILINLISNAAKFTKNGDIKLKLDFEEMDSKHFIKFAVTDTGIGIAEESLSQIFDKFTQVHDTSAENLSGGGLGLALVKSFVQNLHGHITVQSELGVGTEFVVRIPSL